MKIETERDQVRTVADRWRLQYKHWSYISGLPPDAQAKLDALDVESATAADVAAIVGSGAWVSPYVCDECNAKTWQAISLGENPDYESEGARVCLDCLKKAVALIEEIFPEQAQRVAA